jgi:hypothetical protein
MSRKVPLDGRNGRERIMTFVCGKILCDGHGINCTRISTEVSFYRGDDPRRDPSNNMGTNARTGTF